MTLIEQEQVANSIREFIRNNGLKQKFVAQSCKIHEKTFSNFLCGKVTLGIAPLNRVFLFMDGFCQRNG